MNSWFNYTEDTSSKGKYLKPGMLPQIYTVAKTFYSTLNMNTSIYTVRRPGLYFGYPGSQLTKPQKRLLY